MDVESFSYEEATAIEDWPKTRSWDLPTDVDRLADLVDLEHLKTLPVWQAAPKSVKDAVNEKLAELADQRQS